VKRISRYLPVLPLLILATPLANAQSAFDFNIGFGAAQDKASSTQVDQALQPCTPNDLNGPCVSSASLSTFMLGFGGDLMLWKKLGAGAEINIQPAQQTYVNLNASAASQGLNTFSLNTRLTLYDFDAIYEPVNNKKVGLKLKAGFGGANIKFYQAGSSSGSVIGNQNFSQYYVSTNHFQVMGSVGVQIYVTDHMFVRPEFSIHYVPNLTQQFGSNLVKEEMVWVGYSWGDR
jgi:Outer membrane protein beta-barrel domain